MAGADDHFRTLGLTPDAGPAAIKLAFRKLALAWHPDRHSTANEHLRAAAAARFKAITQAYEVLSDDQQRTAYKAWLKSGGQGPGSSWPHAHSATPDPYTGAWQRARQGSQQALRSHRTEVLFVVGVTVLGFAGAAGFFEWLLDKKGPTWSQQSAPTLRATAYVAPAEQSREAPGAAPARAGTTPAKMADLPLSQILALEERCTSDVDC